MTKTMVRMASIFGSLFVLTLALMIILTIFEVMEFDAVKESAVKIGGALLVLLVASGIISAIQSVNED